MPEERKERVLHARIPESLDDEIRENAARLGLSVSNLVRNVLQNAFGLVEDIMADGAAIARTATRGSEPPKRSESGRTIGWQEAVLSVNAVCERCNEVLARGTRAMIGIVEGSGPRPIRCLTCVEERDGGSKHATA
jgi:hypothetical protein